MGVFKRSMVVENAARIFKEGIFLEVVDDQPRMSEDSRCFAKHDEVRARIERFAERQSSPAHQPALTQTQIIAPGNGRSFLGRSVFLAWINDMGNGWIVQKIDRCFPVGGLPD